MAGTSSTPIFVKDAQYLSFTADNDITLGNLVKLTTTGTDTVDVATANSPVLGVAVSGDRFSRTATDKEIEAGSKVTVCTRGIVRVYTGTSAILVGSMVEAGAAGIVELSETAGHDVPLDVVGMALDANGSAATTIRVALMRF